MQQRIVYQAVRVHRQLESRTRSLADDCCAILRHGGEISQHNPRHMNGRGRSVRHLGEEEFRQAPGGIVSEKVAPLPAVPVSSMVIPVSPSISRMR
jgi:hypothetical protein